MSKTKAQLLEELKQEQRSTLNLARKNVALVQENDKLQRYCDDYKRMVCRYVDQIADIDEKLGELKGNPSQAIALSNFTVH